MLVADLGERVREALEDRFRLDREIGRGGMATVFLAEQLQPRRPVAVKVLEPSLATDIARERFLREVEFASQLTHPNIVPIFSSGEADGLLYYVMPYIEGDSLRVHLLRKGRLDFEEAIQIAEEVGDALHYAHSKGVVHRDVKPENILMSNGHAIVADFGIARALCAACDDNLTIAGHPIGTPAYMSPEQGSGEDVDPRTDVYSLGVVLYEMLTGRAPFQGPSLEAVIAAKYTMPTPSLRTAGWTLSDTIDHAVQRALRIERDERFPSVKEFIDSIRPRVTPEAIPETLEAYRWTPTPPERDALAHSIAVLPFANLSSDPENEYFSDGITEDIITQLSKIADLRVTSRTSVQKYRDTTKTASQIGAELRVTKILEGSVRKAGNRVRVVAQLVDTDHDRHLWAERYDRELTDIFELQADLAERIAEALEATLSPAERADLKRKPTDNIQAYNLYQQGRFHWAKFTPDGIREGIGLFTEAVREDPSYALAHAGIADSHLSMAATLGVTDPRDGMPKAKAAALEALRLDPDLADAHATLGAVHDFYEWDWAAAEREHASALRLDPEAEKTHILYSFHLSALGRQDDAIKVMRRIDKLTPACVLTAANVALQLYKARRYEDALDQLRRAEEIVPDFPPIHLVRGWTLLKAGDARGALTAMERAAQLTGNGPSRRAAVGATLVATGRREEAEGIYQELQRTAETAYVSGLDIGLLAAHLDRTDDAFTWLDTAFDQRAPWLHHLNADPVWDPIRDDPRFAALTQRIGLP